jgi:IS30 family transposase
MRNYKRKRLRVDPDKRMAAAARLRAEGLSLRQIAERLCVKSPQTIANDLTRWERSRANVTPLLSKTSVQNLPPGGKKWTPELDSGDSSVVAMSDRRKRA